MKFHLPVALLACLLAGCGKKGEEKAPTPPPTTPAASMESALGELVGYVRFTNNEYGAAVRGGQIVDKQEWDEATEMGLKPAERAWKRLEPQLAAKDAAAAKAVSEGLATLRKQVDAKADPSEVSATVSGLARALEAHIAGGVGPALRATVVSVAAADADIKGEVVIEDYRIGVATFAPRTLGSYDASGNWTAWPKDGATHFLAIVVREKGTKRPLASSRVTASWGGAPVELRPVRGDYDSYGVNAALPEGAFTLSIDIDPPKICRHADALSFQSKAHAEFKVTRRGAEVTVEAAKPGPVNTDYRIAQDVEQAIAESLVMKEEGDYKIGWIAEGPEPFWVWNGDTLESRPAKEDDTHHLEVALLDRATNRILMAAKVSVVLKNKATGVTREIEMHNLLSEFAHYGNTVKLEPAEYEVTIKVVPPAFGQEAEGQFRGPVQVTIDWNGKAGGE